MKRGLFITFEGPDGSGKSTQIELLRNFLDEKGYSVFLTREPGGTRIGEKIRELVLDRNHQEMSPLTEMLLYAASRAQHVDEVIRHRLENGETVISDRFVDSSIVYQGYGRKLGGQVRVVNDFAIGDCIPDATFLLLIRPETSLMRMEKGKEDRIEIAGIDYHRQVYEAYRMLEEEGGDRMNVIDGSLPREAVHQIVRRRIVQLMGKHYGV